MVAPTYSSPSLTALAIAWPATCSGSFLRIQFLSALKFKPATAGLEARTLLSALSFPTTQPLTQESKDRFKLLFYIATLHFKSSSALNFDLFLKKLTHTTSMSLGSLSMLPVFFLIPENLGHSDKGYWINNSWRDSASRLSILFLIFIIWNQRFRRFLETDCSNNMATSHQFFSFIIFL